jgi:ferritin-like metal-binding protein YciE
MPDSSNLNQRDAKLVQWLNEAYAKEAELEADLGAHITLTQKASYKKRLQQHLTETRNHKRQVASRIKKLGGGDASSGLNLPGVPEAVGEVAGKAVAAVKGQVGAARAVVTSQPETHLRNAQEELREEHVEIALYSRIITLAEAVGDRETAQLAKSIRRDEERMAKFLDAELTRLVKEVVRAEIPAALRATTTRRRRSSTTGRRSGTSTRRSTGTSGRSGSSSRSSSGSRSTSRSSGSRSGSSSSRPSSSRSTSARSTSARSTSARSTSGRSTSARSTSGRSTSGTRASSGGTRRPARSTSSRSSGSGSTRSSSNSRSSSGRSKSGTRS